MRKTTNYGLALYDKEDKMNITAEENSLNANMEIIDEALKEKATIDDVANYIEEHKEELKGADGKDGYTPIKGVDYFDGVDGIDGKDYVLTETDKEDISKLVEVNIPTKTSELENDSKFTNEIYVANKIAEAQLGGGDTEIDLSGYATKDDLNKKVDKVAGKSLIADSEITRLASLTNYDDTEIKKTLDSKASLTDVTTYIEEHKDELKGEQGIQGIQGETGPQGPKGDKGDTGEQGPKGNDGTSVTHSWNGTILSVTSANGTTSANLKGEKGDKGDTGATGSQGPKGDTGEKGDTGASGYSPVRGKDYWTDADKSEIKAYVDEAILGGAW